MDIVFSSQIVIAFMIYFLGVASPGPSNLAIMGVAMSSGRRPAMMLALGIILGSGFWGVLAAFGLSTVLTHYVSLLYAMKIAAGFYLLWLAYQSARSAFFTASLNKKLNISPENSGASINRNNNVYQRLFVRGLLLHLTNPKAIFVWLSIVTFSVPASASSQYMFVVVFGCSLIGIIVFLSYAFLFSTVSAQRVYCRLQVFFDGFLAVLFSIAAMRMLFIPLKASDDF
ncbi:LysE family translocator [Eionea flava]